MGQFDRTTQNVGNILGLEHINLLQTDRDLADRFWVSVMGFTRDAYIDRGMSGNMWVNLGSEQLHLPWGGPQRFRGRIGIAVPDVDAVARRLDRLVASFPAAAEAGVACATTEAGLRVTAPFGTELRVHNVADMAHVDRVGIPYIEVDVAPGTAPGITAFYERVMGAPSQVCTTVGAAPTAQVDVGRSQQLRFAETSAELPDYDGHHIGLYVHDFSGPHEWLAARGLVTEESDEHQYRFVHIVDPESGAVCASLEHEVRSMYHPMFGRQLINRNTNMSSRDYRAGDEVQTGLFIAGIG